MDIRARVEEKVYPLLLRNQITWADNLFNQALENPQYFEYSPALIHADLAPYHILYVSSNQEISGVLDFGVAGIGDPALDLGAIISNYGESFVRKLDTSYPGMDALLPRARFYAQAIELQWVLLGIETDDHFWFTAHLGGARDILG
jgi:aminoglycoside 2''-phosphotransferase